MRRLENEQRICQKILDYPAESNRRPRDLHTISRGLMCRLGIVSLPSLLWPNRNHFGEIPFFFPSFLSLLRAIKLDIVSNYSNCPFELKEKLKEEERKRMEKEETKKERSLIRQDKGGGKKEEKKKDR